MKALYLAAALAAVSTLAGAAFNPAQAQTDGKAVQAAATRAKVGTCVTNLYQREGYSGGQKVKVTPLYDRDPALAQYCAGTLNGGNAIGVGETQN